jgi:hypothetical protein
MYSGGFGQSATTRNTLVYEAGDIKVNKRWSLPNGSFIRVVRQDGYGDFEADEHSRLTVYV